MINSLGMTPMDAIESKSIDIFFLLIFIKVEKLILTEFTNARGHKIERQNYIDALNLNSPFSLTTKDKSRHSSRNYQGGRRNAREGSMNHDRPRYCNGDRPRDKPNFSERGNEITDSRSRYSWRRPVNEIPSGDPVNDSQVAGRSNMGMTRDRDNVNYVGNTDHLRLDRRYDRWDDRGDERIPRGPRSPIRVRSPHDLQMAANGIRDMNHHGLDRRDERRDERIPRGPRFQGPRSPIRVRSPHDLEMAGNGNIRDNMNQMRLDRRDDRRDDRIPRRTSHLGSRSPIRNNGRSSNGLQKAGSRNRDNMGNWRDRDNRMQHRDSPNERKPGPERIEDIRLRAPNLVPRNKTERIWRSRSPARNNIPSNF